MKRLGFSFGLAIMVMIFILNVGALRASAQDDHVTFSITTKSVRTITISKSSNGDQSVLIVLNEEQRQAFQELTRENIGKTLDVVFNDEVVASANVRNEMENGNIMISNSKSREEAVRMVEKIWLGKE